MYFLNTTLYKILIIKRYKTNYLKKKYRKNIRELYIIGKFNCIKANKFLNFYRFI